MNREDFKIFENYEKNNSAKLVYFDNASTSQIPNQVIESMNDYYTNHKSNIDRGLYKIEEISTQKYEGARKKVARFLNVENDEVIFTAGATDSSNKLVLLIEKHLAKYEDLYKTKNEILVSVSTHHSELLPLQEYAKRNNLTIKILNTENNLEYFEKEITEKTLLVSMQLVSNVTGLVLKEESVKNIIAKCKAVHAFSVLDISVAVGHMNVNLKDLDCDAAYFSSHKMCGPSGVGILFLKRLYSRDMLPVYVGGGMVGEVNELESNYRSDIKAFEAGTQNIPAVIGFAAAVDYLEKIGLDNIYNHNQELLKYFYKKQETYKLADGTYIKDKIKIYSEENLENNIGIISFAVDDVHAHDVAQILADNNVCVRSGHHCAALLIKNLEVSALTRVSFYFYNTEEDIDLFFIALEKVINKFKI